MLGKYLNMFRFDKKTAAAHNEDDMGRDRREAPLERIVPLMDAPAQPQAVEDRVVDTDQASSVVAHVLDIPTHGVRTEAAELLNRFLGRQAILDRTGDIVAYELRIKKAAPPGGAGAATLAQMHEEMLLASMQDLDIQRLRGNHLVFATVSPATLHTTFLDRMEGQGIVLMFTPDDDVERTVARCEQLHRRGFRFGLEQIQYHEALDPLLARVDYIRIDTGAYDAMQLGELVVGIKSHGDFVLLANRVETEEIYAVCRTLGFDLFEGYFFAKPLPVTPPKLDSARLRVMQILNLAMNQAEISEIERHFKHDPLLSYKLLRYINSPATGLLTPVRSIAHALVVLGYKQLYRWLTLLLFASGQPDHRTLALMKTALVRARLTELLGRPRLPAEDQEGLFIVGVFSLLDALLNMPMEKALESLKLPPAIEAALLRHEGIYAPYLDLAIACEQSEEQVIATYTAAKTVSAEELNLAHLQAIMWAEEVDL